MYNEKAKIFKAIADPKRLEIVEMLTEKEMSAGKLLERFKISQPTLSHDMKILCEAGLVKSQKQGRYQIYTISDDTISKIKNIFIDLEAGCGKENA